MAKRLFFCEIQFLIKLEFGQEMTLENSTSTVDYGINTTCINTSCTEYAEITGFTSGEKRALPIITTAVTDEEESESDGMMVFGFVAMALAGVLIVVGVSLYVNKVRFKLTRIAPESREQ